MQSPHTPPPIPTPDGQVRGVPISTTRGDWQTAPKIVKGWAYPLTWLAMIGFVLLTIFVLMADTIQGAEKIGLLLFYAIFFAGSIWPESRAQKRHASRVDSANDLVGFWLVGFPNRHPDSRLHSVAVVPARNQSLVWAALKRCHLDVGALQVLAARFSRLRTILTWLARVMNSRKL